MCKLFELKELLSAIWECNWNWPANHSQSSLIPTTNNKQVFRLTLLRLTYFKLFPIVTGHCLSQKSLWLIRMLECGSSGLEINYRRRMMQYLAKTNVKMFNMRHLTHEKGRRIYREGAGDFWQIFIVRLTLSGAQGNLMPLNKVPSTFP